MSLKFIRKIHQSNFKSLFRSKMLMKFSALTFHQIDDAGEEGKKQFLI